jgi:hypothetical protein
VHEHALDESRSCALREGKTGNARRLYATQPVATQSTDVMLSIACTLRWSAIPAPFQLSSVHHIHIIVDLRHNVSGVSRLKAVLDSLRRRAGGNGLPRMRVAIYDAAGLPARRSVPYKKTLPTNSVQSVSMRNLGCCAGYEHRAGRKARGTHNILHAEVHPRLGPEERRCGLEDFSMVRAPVSSVLALH